MLGQAVNILNNLLAAEGSSLVSRLRECDAYVAWPSASDRLALDRMIADNTAHQHDLVAMILKLRGYPAPAKFTAMPGGEHYLRLDFLMPHVIASVRSLIRAYESAGPTGSAEADALVSRILTSHKWHLAELERLHSNLAGAAPQLSR
jgi:hypothetical protein